MALTVVKESYDDRSGTIIVQSQNQEEVISLDAKRLVAKQAVMRLGGKAGLSGAAHPYPVDADGNSNDDLIFGRNGATVAGYRADYAVSGGA